MTFNHKIRTLQVLNVLVATLGIFWVFYSESYSWLIVGLIAFVIFGVFGANIGMHRLFAHRSFITYAPVEKVLLFLATLTTMGSTISWVGLHRFHHSHSDLETDPHSPHVIGSFKAWIGNWQKVVIDTRLTRDLTRSKAHRFFHKNYFKVIFAWNIVLFIFHPLAPVFAYCLPASLCLQGSSVVTVLCHRWGYRTYSTTDSSLNNWLGTILSLGEGWHNNHHQHPRSHRQGYKWWELDPSAWIIENLLSSERLPKVEPKHG